MSSPSASFDPFAFFRAPLSGDVAQRISAPWFSPSLTVNYAGDAPIEDRVVTEVASYGRQLGWLSEIALALAQGRPVPDETLHRLARAAAQIEDIKQQVRPDAAAQAVQALDRLRQVDPSGYRTLVQRRARTAAQEPGAKNS